MENIAEKKREHNEINLKSIYGKLQAVLSDQNDIMDEIDKRIGEIGGFQGYKEEEVPGKDPSGPGSIVSQLATMAWLAEQNRQRMIRINENIDKILNG